jgi:hypothetical protein
MPTVDENIEVSITPKKPVIVATPLKDGEAAPILDEEKYNTILGMLKSGDEGNHKIAQLILNTCDIEKSIYWIWRLTKVAGHWNMVNLRTKASRAFRDKSELFNISNKSHLAFAEWLIKKDWMTPENFQRLEDEVLNTLAKQHRNKFYDVTISIRDKYKHLPLTKTPIPIGHEETTG